MANSMDANLTQALSEIIRDALVSGGKIIVPGLGTFSVRHEPSQITNSSGGRVLVSPPRDVVGFIPDTHRED